MKTLKTVYSAESKEKPTKPTLVGVQVELKPGEIDCILWGLAMAHARVADNYYQGVASCMKESEEYVELYKALKRFGTI
jgi:hypothetical protein